MSVPHYFRILVTNPETLAYMEWFMQRREAGTMQLVAFSKSIGATRCRFGRDDRPFSFEGFTATPDSKVWKKHPAGGYALRKTVAKGQVQQRDELQAQMRAIQVPGPRTLTSELHGDLFACIGSNAAYYMNVDSIADGASHKFVISYPVLERGTPLPEKAATWGSVIKESEYHALLEARDAAEKAEGAAR